MRQMAMTRVMDPWSSLSPPVAVIDAVVLDASVVRHLAARDGITHETAQQRAIETLRLAHRSRPEYIDVRIDLASALILRGDEIEGLAMLEEVDRLAPEFIDTAELADELRQERDEETDEP